MSTFKVNDNNNIQWEIIIIVYLQIPFSMISYDRDDLQRVPIYWSLYEVLVKGVSYKTLELLLLFHLSSEYTT